MLTAVSTGATAAEHREFTYARFFLLLSFQIYNTQLQMPLRRLEHCTFIACAFFMALAQSASPCGLPAKDVTVTMTYGTTVLSEVLL